MTEDTLSQKINAKQAAKHAALSSKKDQDERQKQVFQPDDDDKLLPPKRPMNGYNFFFKEERERLVGESSSPLEDFVNGYTVKRKRSHRKIHGKISLVDLAKTVGRKWQSLDEEQQERYRKLAEVDGDRYKQDVKVYKELLKRIQSSADALKGRKKSSMQRATPALKKVFKVKNSPNVPRPVCSQFALRNTSALKPTVLASSFAEVSKIAQISFLRPSETNTGSHKLRVTRKRKRKGQDNDFIEELEPIDLNVMQMYSMQSVELSLLHVLQGFNFDPR
jgi:hypothetical protein